MCPSFYTSPLSAQVLPGPVGPKATILVPSAEPGYYKNWGILGRGDTCCERGESNEEVWNKIGGSERTVAGVQGGCEDEVEKAVSGSNC